MTPISECIVVTTDHDAKEFSRFLEWYDLMQQPGLHRIPFPDLIAFQRLLVKYGVYTIDAVMVGPPDPSRTPRAVAILNTDCKPIPGDKPLICPRSRPQLPPELLPPIEQRCRALGRVRPGETILWVGRGAEMETLCLWDHGCSCFGPTERMQRWGRAAAALVTALGQVLQKTLATEGLASALTQSRNWVRVLGPLGCWSKADGGPEFPPREFSVALIEPSEALEILEQQRASEGSTITHAALLGPSWERLVNAAEAFWAAAGSVWPEEAATAVPIPPQSEKGETCEASVTPHGSAIRRLLFEPGAFVYGAHRHQLSGKPLHVLEALAKARGQVLTLAALRECCWDDG